MRARCGLRIDSKEGKRKKYAGSVHVCLFMNIWGFCLQATSINGKFLSWTNKLDSELCVVTNKLDSDLCVLTNKLDSELCVVTNKLDSDLCVVTNTIAFLAALMLGPFCRSCQGGAPDQAACYLNKLCLALLWPTPADWTHKYSFHACVCIIIYIHLTSCVHVRRIVFQEFFN